MKTKIIKVKLCSPSIEVIFKLNSLFSNCLGTVFFCQRFSLIVFTFFNLKQIYAAHNPHIFVLALVPVTSSVLINVSAVYLVSEE